MLSVNQLISILAINSAIAVAANVAGRYRSPYTIRSNQLSVVAEWWCCSLTLPLAYMAPFLSTSQPSACAFLSFASFLGDTRAWRTLFQLAVGASCSWNGYSIKQPCQMPTAQHRTQPYTAMPAATFADDFGYFSREQRSVHFG